MTRLAASVVALALFGGLGPASAQAVRNATIMPDKPARLAVVTSLKKDCSIGPVGSIRVTTQPKNGVIVVRGSKLKTPAAFRCPNVETEAQALFYEPKKGFQGTDELAYETKDSEGATQTITIKLTVSSKPAPKSGTGTGTGGGVVDL